jgi:hypothetical protein
MAIHNSMKTHLQSWVQNWGNIGVVLKNTIQSVPVVDCVVYIVNSFNSGFARGTLQGLGTSASAAQQQQLAQYSQSAMDVSTNIQFLGVTVLDVNPAVSEVWVSRVIQLIRGTRRYSTNWTDAELESYGYALAHMAVHEMMHNKVDPNFGPNWNLHIQNPNSNNPRFTRGIANGLTMGQEVLQRWPPHATDNALINQFFSTPRAQATSFSFPTTNPWSSGIISGSATPAPP